MTLDQAKQYLTAQGIELPDFIIEAMLAEIDERKECLDEHYSKSTVLLIYSYLLALMGLSQTQQFIASQSISGAVSRSFTYKDGANAWQGYLKLLKGLDKKGCIESLIPDDPFKSKKGFMMSVRGSCYE